MPDQEINIVIDGQTVKTTADKTIIQAATEAGLYIPYLCYYPKMKPFGACRMCVVDVENQNGTPAACTTPVNNGMVVSTNTPEIQELRKGIIELLLSEHPHGCLTCHRVELCGPEDVCLRHISVNDRCVTCPKNERCELKDTVRMVGVDMETPLTYKYRNLPIETGDPFYDRDYNLCIVCARCVRVCEEVRGDDAITMVDRGGQVLVGTSNGTSLLESGCEFCGACIDTCPVGALVETDHKWEKSVKDTYTTCPHCPVGCQTKLEVNKNDTVIRSIGDIDGIPNEGQLCFKGKFGMEFINHKKRLTEPLVRKGKNVETSTWKDAISEIASNLKKYTGKEVAFLASPRSTNEETYLLQKFARTVMNTNNIDTTSNTQPELFDQAKACLGIESATNPISDLETTNTVMVINSNITEDHNVMAIPIKKGHKAGNKLIVIDSREVELTRYADIWLRPLPKTELILIGGILRVILDESIEDADFITKYCKNIAEVRKAIWDYDLVKVERLTGIDKESIQNAARVFAANGIGAIVYALDNIQGAEANELVKAILDLSLITGNIDKKYGGIYPLLPGANDQGARDMGCNPSLLPGQIDIDDIEGKKALEKMWSSEIPETDGIGMSAILDAVDNGQIKAMQIIGDSPNFDDRSYEILSKLDFLLVHDNFDSKLTDIANIVLPSASFAEKTGTYTNLERRAQPLRKALEPKGNSKSDAIIICEIAAAMNSEGFGHKSSVSITKEISNAVLQYSRVTGSRASHWNLLLECTASVPNSKNSWFGQKFAKSKCIFPIPDTNSRINEPIPEYPLVMVPGRVLIEPESKLSVIKEEEINELDREDFFDISSEDASKLQITHGDLVEAISQENSWKGRARVNGSHAGVIYWTSLFGQLATKLQKSSEPDPMLKTPKLEIQPIKLQKIT